MDIVLDMTRNERHDSKKAFHEGHPGVSLACNDRSRGTPFNYNKIESQ
ncbi:hypothetical protein AKJ09_01306 [Labilithrix luteola]|uniref:Uncharacterized protein n=1 Tax=Labilithrix luteola TaxID=1391654 RepID=A0A0K1PM88_9BACT|nr:hypothetical protein AKJ09_01306 [Labilithrix luteola]